MLPKINICAKKIILITGFTRSGKTLLCPIISSLKDCEQFFFSTISENISVLHYMKSINFNTADYMIKRTINENVQDKLLGRNLNNKKNDFTSLNNYKNKNIYIKRMRSTKKGNFEKSKEFKNNFFPILFHEGLMNLRLLEKSFNFPKIINISRHPIDLITSWIKKGYVNKHYSSITNTVLTYMYKEKKLPFFCLGIEKKILKQKNKEDKIVQMINNLNKIFKKNYLNSKKRKNIILIKHDDFVTNPNKFINQICSRFSIGKTKFLKTVLKEQKCPRKINYKQRDKNLKNFFSKLSNENKKILNKLIIQYENNELTF
tara:strand:+ start:2198 stop:3148 length:951 start_codon:yes stop_codon:yes gene_type:complete